MRVLVTGGSGFIGRHVVDALLREGADVVILDSKPPAARHAEVPWIDVDLLSPELAARWEDADAVIHLAARTQVIDSIEDAPGHWRTNVEGTWRMLEAARRARRGKNMKVVLASSAAVYGPDGKVGAVNPYGLTKLVNEEQLALARRMWGASGIALRFFNVYGPGQPVQGRYASVIARFTDNARRGEPLPVRSPGSQQRDYIHVTDVARACLLALRSPWQGVVDIGTGSTVSVQSVAEAVRARTQAQIVHVDRVEGDLAHSVADPKPARDHLGFAAAVTLDEGLDGLLVRS